MRGRAAFAPAAFACYPFRPMSRRPSDIDPFSGSAPVPYARPVTADKARQPIEPVAEAPAAAPSDAAAKASATLAGVSKAVREAGEVASEMRKVDKDLEFLIRA